jgi:hypothetical protein
MAAYLSTLLRQWERITKGYFMEFQKVINIGILTINHCLIVPYREHSKE